MGKTEALGEPDTGFKGQDKNTQYAQQQGSNDAEQVLYNHLRQTSDPKGPDQVLGAQQALG